MMNYGDYELKPPGGSLPVPGGPLGTDTQPAWLTPGEFVVPADKVKGNEGILEAIREGLSPLTGRQTPRMNQIGMAGEGFPGGVQYMASGGTAGQRRKILLKRRRKARRAREAREARNVETAKRQQAREESKKQTDYKKKRQKYFEAAETTKTGLSGVADKSAGEALGGVYSAVGRIGEMLPGPLGTTVQGLAKLGEVAAKSTDILKNWNISLHKANIQFAEWSGAMAGVAARQEVREIYLAMERGNVRANSAEFLATGKTELEQNLMPMENAWARIKNDVVGLADRIWSRSPAARGWNTVFRAANAVLDLLEGGGVGKSDTMTPQAYASEYYEKYGRPKKRL